MRQEEGNAIVRHHPRVIFKDILSGAQTKKRRKPGHLLCAAKVNPELHDREYLSYLLSIQ
jgi:hypothetical protein